MKEKIFASIGLVACAAVIYFAVTEMRDSTNINRTMHIRIKQQVNKVSRWFSGLLKDLPGQKPKPIVTTSPAKTVTSPTPISKRYIEPERTQRSPVPKKKDTTDFFNNSPMQDMHY